MIHLIGEKYRDKLEPKLCAIGAPILWLPNNPNVDQRLSGHADLSVAFADGTIIAEKGIYTYLVNILTSREYKILSASEQESEYPHDAGLCVCTVGNTTIYNPKTVDQVLRQHLSGRLISVTQGYTRCSICVVSEKAIITSDTTIYCKAKKAGIDALQIRPGYIALDGFDYGFIGGATFLLDASTMAFTGQLSEHPDKERILRFLREHGVSVVFLTDEPIFDIGGAVTLP